MNTVEKYQTRFPKVRLAPMPAGDPARAAATDGVPASCPGASAVLCRRDWAVAAGSAARAGAPLEAGVEGVADAVAAADSVAPAA
jgi:hypothetical protein